MVSIKMIQDQDIGKVVRVTEVFLRMKNFNIAALERACGEDE